MVPIGLVPILPSRTVWRRGFRAHASTVDSVLCSCRQQGDTSTFWTHQGIAVCSLRLLARHRDRHACFSCVVLPSVWAPDCRWKVEDRERVYSFLSHPRTRCAHTLSSGDAAMEQGEEATTRTRVRGLARRLLTFQNWMHAFKQPNPLHLAKSGRCQ